MRIRLSWLVKRVTAWRLYLLICGLVFFHNEVFTYWRYYSAWPEILKNKDSVTILLIADPQIVGYDREPRLLGPLTRRDNYHYLWLTFRLATYHCQPDLTVFLGDLTDEGSTASDERFQEYAETFYSIYGRDESHMYLHGDNDVGGETGDDRTVEKTLRFHKLFGETPTVRTYKFLNLVKLSNNYLDADRETVYALSRQLELDSITVLLNHDTIVPFHRQQYKLLLEELDPSLAIVGHVHAPHIVKCRDCASAYPGFDTPEPANGSDQITLQLSTARERRKTMYELVVPTCSYRMGERQMAFGLVQIDRSGRMIYTYLWLPRRLKLMNLYFLLPPFFLLLLFYKLLIYIRDDARRYGKLVKAFSRPDVVVSVRERGYGYDLGDD